jgi:hypothetical protein
MSGFIYAIYDPVSLAVKIGYTSVNPWARLSQIQTGNPTRLELIAFSKGNRADERWIHQRFKERRLTGEWFSECRELAQYVTEMRDKSKYEQPTPSGAARDFLGLRLSASANAMKKIQRTLWPHDYDLQEVA